MWASPGAVAQGARCAQPPFDNHNVPRPPLVLPPSAWRTLRECRARLRTRVCHSPQLTMSLLMSPDVTYPETAPLLRTVSHPDDAEYPQQDPPSFFERVAAVVQEPLSPLTQILLVATIIFLLLSSVFIGLFAGAQHKLNAGKGGGTTTIVVTATSTAVSTATTTAISTTTVAVPAPGPTSPPAEVSSRSHQPLLDILSPLSLQSARLSLTVMHQPRVLRALLA